MNPCSKKIIHIDMDAFFASVEQRDRPELRGKPIVVGGRPGGRGVVAAASYEARAFGVRSAMPANQAQRLCPELIFVRPNFEQYKNVSDQVKAIFLSYTPLVEPLSLDEAYLDVTDLHPSATWVANEIRAKIHSQTGLTASAGVAPGKFFAKIASDINKPNGIFVLTPSQVVPFLASLPIRKFYGIGEATEQKMQKLGIHTGADLQERSLEYLVRHFGKHGHFLHQVCQGIDPREVKPKRERKSISVERTFSENLFDPNHIDQMLHQICRELAARMEKKELTGRTLHLKVRFGNFETLTRSFSRNMCLQTEEELYEAAHLLLKEAPDSRFGIRLLGVGCSHFPEKQDPEQLCLPF